MALQIADRVLETSTTTGTGAYTLAGAVAGFRAFSAVCAAGDLVNYYAEEVDVSGNPSGGWEIGIGTFSSGTLTRTQITASSNSGAAVSWGVGTRRIGVTMAAAMQQPISALALYRAAIDFGAL